MPEKYRNTKRLFGNALDKKFYGMFHDVEKHFGCLGSVYDFKPEEDTYSIIMPDSMALKEYIEAKIPEWIQKATIVIYFPYIEVDEFVIDKKYIKEKKKDLLVLSI
jgi:hypothetical protein